MQSAKVNEASGGVDVLIWDGTEDCIITFLKLLAVFSGEYIGTCVSRFSTIYRIYISDNPEGLWQSITSGRLVHTLPDTENICAIPSILRVTL